MNLQQQEHFYQAMTRLRANSRAASSQAPREDAMITEVLNGLIVTRPAKKIEHISEAKPSKEAQPQIWNLTKDGPVLQSKAGSMSVPGINKLRTRSNGKF